jgi:hypothetical protein
MVRKVSDYSLWSLQEMFDPDELYKLDEIAVALCRHKSTIAARLAEQGESPVYLRMPGRPSAYFGHQVWNIADSF